MTMRAAVRLSAVRPCGRQRGAAVVTALLMVTLAVVVVSGMLWRQQVQDPFDREPAPRWPRPPGSSARRWTGRGLILRDDQRRSQGRTTSASRGRCRWRKPGLSHFLGAGLRTRPGRRDLVSVGPHHGHTQARFNLTNLVLSGRPNPTDGTGRSASIDQTALTQFQRLLQNGQSSMPRAGRAHRAVPAARRAQHQFTTSWPARRPPDTVDDLLAGTRRVRPDMVAVLESFVAVLPERTKVNANTAEPEVLSAVIEKLSLDRARELVRQRDRAYFNNTGDITASCPPWRRRPAPLT